MNANTAIAFFSNKQIANRGLTSSKGKVHAGNNLESFDTLFSRTMKTQSTEKNTHSKTKIQTIFTSQLTASPRSEASTLKETKSIDNQFKNGIFDTEKPVFAIIEIPQESITTDKNGRIQLNVASLSSELKQKLGIGEEETIEIKAFNLTQEQMSLLTKQKNPPRLESQSNLEEEKQIAQQRVLFAQFNPETTQSPDNPVPSEGHKNLPFLYLNINPEEETEYPILHIDKKEIAISPKEEKHNPQNPVLHSYKNGVKRDSIHSTNSVSPRNDNTINIPKPVQTDKGLETHPPFEGNETTPITPSNHWNFERADREVRNFILQNPISTDDENPLPLLESWPESASGTGFSDLLSQAGDWDRQPWQQEPGQDNPEIPKRLYLFQVKEDSREEGNPNPKRVFLVRSLPENSESQHDSTGTENENSEKDDSESFQEMVRRAEWEQRNVLTKLDSKSQASDKSESLFKENTALAEKPSKPVQSQKQDISLLQQQLGNNRDAVILEASNNSQSTPMPQTGNRSEIPQLSHTNSGQSANSTLSAIPNLGVQTSETQTSMVQHYAEKVAEVQEAAARQIVRGVQGSIGSERSHITMRLVPESLGRIHIQMTIENGTLTAQITAHKEDTRVLLQQSVNSLRSAFEESGIKVDRLVINKDTLDLKQNDLGRQEESQDRSSKNRSGFEHRSGQNGQYNPGRQSRQQNATWSERMTAMDYFM